MKNKSIFLILVLLSFVGISFIIFSTTMNITNTTKDEKDMRNSKTLIVYYSRSGNTKTVAELIQEKVGGEIVLLETKEARPSNYQEEVAQNEQEQSTNIEPELKPSIPDFEDYDRIFIGAPTWNMALPQAVITFMNSYDFSGKVVLPFNTNGGYGVGSSFEQIKSSLSAVKVLEGFSVHGGEEGNGILLAIKGNRKTKVSQEIDTWLEKIGQSKK